MGARGALGGARDAAPRDGIDAARRSRKVARARMPVRLRAARRRARRRAFFDARQAPIAARKSDRHDAEKRGAQRANIADKKRHARFAARAD